MYQYAHWKISHYTLNGDQPSSILTVLNPKFGFNQGDIKQDTAIQELENLQSNLLGEMSILINYFWSCLKAVSCTI